MTVDSAPRLPPAAGPAVRIDLEPRRRASKWDRPPRRDWRWWTGGLGKVMVATGLLMFAFVAYQLWGTGIETARHQRSLADRFDAALEAAPDVVAPDGPVVVSAPTRVDGTEPAGTPSAADDAPVPVTIDPTQVVPVARQNLPPVDPGDAIARLEIPAIDVDKIVVAGVATGDLKRGPGHFPDTPLPGQLGNAAIAGHRTTYGQPFFDLDRLRVGDDIVVTTLSGRYTYRVTADPFVVAPSDYWVVSTSDPAISTITLTSCHPRWTARERIVVQATLDPARSGPVGAPVLGYGATPGAPGAAAIPGDTAAGDAATADAVADAGEEPQRPTPDPGSGTSGAELDGSDQAPDGTDPGAATTSGIADAFADGWFSDPAAYPHIAAWGALLTLIAVAAYLLSRRVRRDWVGAAAGLVPFVLALFFFFQNVNRLLPPNL